MLFVFHIVLNLYTPKTAIIEKITQAIVKTF